MSEFESWRNTPVGMSDSVISLRATISSAGFERNGVVDGSNDDLLVGFLLQNSGDDAARVGFDQGDLKLRSDPGAGVDDVSDQALWIVALNAGQIRTDRPALAKQHVALRTAGQKVHGRAACRRGHRFGSNQLFQSRDFGLRIGIGRSWFTPKPAQSLRHRRVIQGEKLTRHFSPDV